MQGIGHNQGPAMDAGVSWRRHCWQAARSALLPTLPIEVLRLRVNRAKALGLEYRTYASIRATSGHDVIAFLFSSNALRLLPPNARLSEARAQRLSVIEGAGRGVLTRGALGPAAALALAAPLLDHAATAPRPFAGFAEQRRVIEEALRTPGWRREGVVLVGDTAEERDWTAAARLAWYLPAEAFFAA